MSTSAWRQNLDPVELRRIAEALEERAAIREYEGAEHRGIDFVQSGAPDTSSRQSPRALNRNGRP